MYSTQSRLRSTQYKLCAVHNTDCTVHNTGYFKLKNVLKVFPSIQNIIFYSVQLRTLKRGGGEEIILKTLKPERVFFSSSFQKLMKFILFCLHWLNPFPNVFPNNWIISNKTIIDQKFVYKNISCFSFVKN